MTRHADQGSDPYREGCALFYSGIRSVAAERIPGRPASEVP